jgi:hypothetical protein
VSSFQDKALPMLAKGLHVIRLRHKSKVPLDKNWPALATLDADVVAAWSEETPAANCAVTARPNGVLFFEADQPDVVERFERETRQKFETYTVCSRPGRHHYYFLQTDLSRKTGTLSQALLLFGSLRQENAYVVSPGSVHPVTGEEYTVVHDVPIIPIPDAFIEWLWDQRTSKTPMASSGGLPGKRVPHGSHDIELTRIAGVFRHMGFNADEMLPRMIRYVEEDFDGYGSDYRQMAKKCAESIGRKEPGPIGGTKLGPLESYKGLLDNTDKHIVPWILQNVPLDTELSAEPQKWIVDEVILEHGLHLFSGKSGSMKTMLMQLLARCIATRTPFAGRAITPEPLVLVYIDAENPQSEVRKRLAGMGLTGLIHVWGDWNPENPRPTKFDDERLIECARLRNTVFIFDSLSSFENGVDENSTEMSRVMDPARALARLSAAVVIIHHQGKAAIGSRGSTSIAAAADMAFIVDRCGSRITLTSEKFRCCNDYRLAVDVEFEPFKHTVAEDTRGRASNEATTDSEKDFYVKKAVEAIAKRFELGKAPYNQITLANAIGLTSNRKKQEILNGDPRNPWLCRPGPRGSVLFESKPEEALEQCPPLVEQMDDSWLNMKAVWA